MQILDGQNTGLLLRIESFYLGSIHNHPHSGASTQTNCYTTEGIEVCVENIQAKS